MIVGVPTDEKQGFAKGLRWLVAQQNIDGSWGGEGPGLGIDRLVTTCQVLTLLLDAGCGLSSNPVRKAKEFLLDKRWGDYSVGNMTSYWRIEPFSRIATDDPNALKACEMELKQLLRSVREGRFPGHSFTLPLYALKCIHLMNHSGQNEAEYLIEKAVTSGWSGSDACFSDRADMASLALSWLVRDTWPPSLAGQKRTILNACKQYINSKATTSEAGTSWEAGHVVRTAYICINTAEALQPDNDLVAKMPSASKFLLALQNKRGFWQKREGERSPVITSREYYTAVALRGLLASAKLQRSSLLTEMWAGEALEHWSFLRRFTWLATALVGLLLYCLGSGSGQASEVSRYLEDPKVVLYSTYFLGLPGAFGFFQYGFSKWRNRR